jgi:hypothetical protein
MARYTCIFKIAIPMHDLHSAIYKVLESCNLKILYNTDEYIMAREAPGDIAFSKLVTAEVLIDRTLATDQEVRMKCVVKNEELPLQVDNHCHSIFEAVQNAMTETANLQVIEAVSG